MKKIAYISCCILLPLILTGAGNQDIIRQLQDALASFNEKFPQEKVYIQTDKTYYIPSESIWYKGYLVNASDNKPSRTGDVVYIELQDPWGNVIDIREQYVISGTFEGSFPLPENRPGGIYKIVSYTNWMKNWGEENYFSKEVTIQKILTPRLLLKLDFEKRAYGPGDEVVVNLKVTDLNNIKTTGSRVRSSIRIAGKEYKNIESKTTDGEVAIRFQLPVDLSSNDGIFQAVVTDKGIEESISRAVPIVLNKIDLQFFPEGGDPVAGTENKIAFEALNEFGKGADIKGVILDDSGREITSFESFRLGMGTFSFTPQKGRKYYAKITTPLGNDQLRELPEIREKGYVLSLTKKENKTLEWNIFSPENKPDASIVAHTQGIIQYSKKLNLKKGKNKLEINTEDFPAGIAVFTLFNGAQESAERLVFLNPDKGLQIKLTTDKESYVPGDLVKLTIETGDASGNPVSAAIGLSVADEQLLTLADDKQDNLLSYLLFSSELKGKIQEPAFYFDPEEPKAEEARELLMLTHGWRRFSWEEVLNPPEQKFENQAEKLGSVYGYVLDDKGNPIRTDVFIIELGGKKRIAKLNTTSEGHFVFHNTDMTDGVFVSAKLPNRVYLIDGNPLIAEERVLDTEEGSKIDLNPRTVSDSPEKKKEEARPTAPVTERFESDQSLLEEMVVVGYGTYRREHMAHNVSAIRTQDINFFSTPERIISGLTGITPGLITNTQDIGAASHKYTAIRGMTTLNTEPLVVINGIPISETFSQAISMINPSDIESISVLKSVNGSAVYGSQASNGTIEIITKKPWFDNKYKPARPNYTGKTIRKKQFYTSPAFTQTKDNPTGEGSTVYWNGAIRTDSTGKASIRFLNNKRSSTYRITAEGIDPQKGLLGSVNKRIVVGNDFSADAKTPLFAGCGDTVKIPVMLKNQTNSPMKVNLRVETDSLVTLSEPIDLNPEIPANHTSTVFIPLKAGSFSGETQLIIHAKAGKYKERIVRRFTIRQINFPYRFGFSGRSLNDRTEFHLPDHVEGTLNAEAVVYVELTNELFAGAESIFREPYGCFEQVLSSAFPNVFALQLLQATGKGDNRTRAKALEYLENGYKKLANYEVAKTGGFEWYGGSPAHEMLTAYGLVHFYELEKVYDKVDKAMTERALGFLLSRRDGKGGFKQNNGRYGFSGAPVKVNNAYIVYALTEIGKGNEIDSEYTSVLKEALNSKDAYRMALLANAAYLRGDKASYHKLIEQLKGLDFSTLKIEATIVRSAGEAQNREAAAYWLMALLKEPAGLDRDLIQKCLAFISKGKSGGSFGNTQTTSVCLQALTKYALFTTTDLKGTFCMDANNQKECIDLPEKVNKKTEPVIDFTSALKKGKNTLVTGFSGTKLPYSYGINISWHSATPPSSKSCPLRVSVHSTDNEIKVNETMRLSVKLKNQAQNALPMSVAIIGIPGGMSLQPWQLKELREKEIFDFYEITDDNLVIYYRELGPEEEKVIHLDLKAEIPGTYRGTASRAYVYYDNEHNHWIPGIEIKINEE